MAKKKTAKKDVDPRDHIEKTMDAGRGSVIKKSAAAYAKTKK